MNKTKRLAPAFALALTMSVLFFSRFPASSTQQGQADRYGSRKPACGCFCGGPTPDYVLFGLDDCAGILSADLCGESLAGLPQEDREGLCRTVKAQRKLDSCPVFAPICGPEGDGSQPPKPDRDGIADGFGGPPPASPTAGPSPPRLVYLIAGVPADGSSVASFTVYLDRAACLLPLDADNPPSAPAAAKHVVRGRIVRGGGRVRIEAEASELAGVTKLGPFTSEAKGEGAAAVASATRVVLKQMNLVCRR